MGKSTISRRIAESKNKSVLIEGDDIYHQVVGGYVQAWKEGNHLDTFWKICLSSIKTYLEDGYDVIFNYVEENETNDEAAYRELFEETGISKNDIELDHFMDLNYFKYENNLQVYYGILTHDVDLVEEKNKLEWVELNKELLDNNKFGGNYNIPHIITQIKVFIKNGTGLGKY